MNRCWCGAATFLGWLLVAVPAQAQTIDFEAIATSSFGLVSTGSSTYQEDGYEVANIFPDEVRTLERWGTKASNFRESTHITGQSNNDPLRLRKVDGGLFKLVSLKLTTFFTSQASTTVEFIGRKSDNSTVSTTLVTSGPTPQKHFLPSTFDNLVSVSWSTGDSSESWNQVDAFVVVSSDSPASAVPEPSSALLFIPAFAVVAVAVRRRQSSREPVSDHEG